MNIRHNRFVNSPPRYLSHYSRCSAARIIVLAPGNRLIVYRSEEARPAGQNPRHDIQGEFGKKVYRGRELICGGAFRFGEEMLLMTCPPDWQNHMHFTAACGEQVNGRTSQQPNESNTKSGQALYAPYASDTAMRNPSRVTLLGQRL